MRIVQAYHIREGKIVYAADGYLVHQKRAEAQGLPLLERALLLAPRHMKKLRYITTRTMTCAADDKLLFFTQRLCALYSQKDFWLLAAPFCKSVSDRQYYYDLFVFESP